MKLQQASTCYARIAGLRQFGLVTRFSFSEIRVLCSKFLEWDRAGGGGEAKVWFHRIKPWPLEIAVELGKNFAPNTGVN